MCNRGQVFNFFIKVNNFDFININSFETSCNKYVAAIWSNWFDTLSFEKFRNKIQLEIFIINFKVIIKRKSALMCDNDAKHLDQLKIKIFLLVNRRKSHSLMLFHLALHFPSTIVLGRNSFQFLWWNLVHHHH